MREQFPWFLDPTEEELQRLWDEATFSFDANVLLNLYRVDKETTEDYFKIFRALGDRIFLPHEAAHQFFRNRRGVIQTEQNSFSEAKKRVRDWVGRRTGFDNLKQQLRGGDIGQIIEDEIESVFEDREDYEGEVEAVKDDLIERIEDLEERFTPTGTTRANAEEDEILGELIEIFEGKTGSVLEEDMEDLKEEAQERYESEQPPGYEDYDEDEDVSRGECEDFLIWRQLIEYAEREGEDIVFITGEKKKDWWEVDDKHEIVRPRHELLREFSRETEQSFWMLLVKPMLNCAHERLGVEVKDKSVEQTDKIPENRQKYTSEGEYVSEKNIEDKKILRYDKLRKKSRQIEDKIDVLRQIEDGVDKGMDEELESNFKVWTYNTDRIIRKSREVSKAIGRTKADKFIDKVGVIKKSIYSSDIYEVKSELEGLETYLKQLSDAVRAEAEAILTSLPH